MFGETAPNYSELQQAIRHCSLFVAIGTSGHVIDITNIAKEFKHSILIDPKRQSTQSQFDPKAYIDEYFEHYIAKNATDAMDELISIIKNYLEK
jgi:NAD-dependent SIR2 family protein deacetylase